MNTERLQEGFLRSEARGVSRSVSMGVVIFRRCVVIARFDKSSLVNKVGYD